MISKWWFLLPVAALGYAIWYFIFKPVYAQEAAPGGGTQTVQVFTGTLLAYYSAAPAGTTRTQTINGVTYTETKQEGGPDGIWIIDD